MEKKTVLSVWYDDDKKTHWTPVEKNILSEMLCDFTFCNLPRGNDDPGPLCILSTEKLWPPLLYKGRMMTSLLVTR